MQVFHTHLNSDPQRSARRRPTWCTGSWAMMRSWAPSGITPEASRQTKLHNTMTCSYPSWETLSIDLDCKFIVQLFGHLDPYVFVSKRVRWHSRGRWKAKLPRCRPSKQSPSLGHLGRLCHVLRSTRDTFLSILQAKPTSPSTCLLSMGSHLFFLESRLAVPFQATRPISLLVTSSKNAPSSDARGP